MAKGIKDEPHYKESQDIDLEEFRAKLKSCLKGVEDPRASDNKTYQFASLIGITLCAIIAGANGISDIQIFLIKRPWVFL